MSNVLIQSSVNSFGSVVVAGNTAASNLEGFIYTSMNSVYQASLSFTSQNVGAGKLERVVPVLWRCLAVVFVVGAGMCGLALLFMNQLLGVYSGEAEVIRYGAIRLGLICSAYFFCGMMDVACGSVRGLGYSIAPTVVFPDWRLRPADFMDLYGFCLGPFFVHPVFILSGNLGDYLRGPYGLLLHFPEKGKKEGGAGGTAPRAGAQRGREYIRRAKAPGISGRFLLDRVKKKAAGNPSGLLLYHFPTKI